MAALYLEGTAITDTSNVNKNVTPVLSQRIPTIYTWRDRKYIKADGIFSILLSQKGNIYKIRQIGESKERFLVTDGFGKWAHGDSLKEAKEDLVYKISNRDKSHYENLTLDSELSFKEAIEAYRVITGACSMGTRNFVENKLVERKEKYKISDIIKITESEYGGSVFKQFFHK